MSSWEFTFPVSRTCLWDSSPSGKTAELSMTKNGWLLVQVSSSCLQLALNHVKSSTSKSVDCFLIATSWISEGENITLEVNRFDPGHSNKERTVITPTSLIAGDIPVKTQVVIDAHPDSKYLVHNLNSLQETLNEMSQSLSLQHTMTLDPSHRHTTTLDPSRLLSLRIHCSCSHNGAVTLQCGCVMPSLLYQATPISSIPIVPTALARNLSGPLPLSQLQGRVKHGYITMEASRKLVLLLHSDPIVPSLPLIGVWVGGVGSVQHPMVWSACAAFTHSTALRDRVCGEGGTFVTLVYSEGCSQPSFWECRIKESQEGSGKAPFQISTGEATIRLSSQHSLFGVSLHPAQESTALHTLLETTLASTPPTSHSRELPSTTTTTTTTRELPSTTTTAATTTSAQNISFDSPLPSPLPTPSQAPERIVRDKNLSVISSLSTVETPPQTPRSGGSEDTPQPVPPRLSLSPSPQAPRSRGEPSIPSAVAPPLNSRQDAQQQTTPTSGHVPAPSNHMTLEEQLKTLQDKVECLMQAQSPNSTTTPTAEAATNTGASLCWSPRPPITPSSHHLSSQCGGCVTGDLSVSTATSILSSNTTNMHLDLHSFAYSSSTQSQSFGDSASVSIPVDMDQQLDFTEAEDEEEQLSPTSVPSLQQWSAEDILADALEKVQILDRLQSQRRHSPPGPGGHDHGDSQSSTPQSSPPDHQNRSGSCSSLEGGGEQKRRSFSGGSGSPRRRMGSSNGDLISSGGQQRGQDRNCENSDDDDGSITPIPLHDTKHMSPHDLGVPPPPHYLHPPPFVTPLSAKNAHYLLHPEVLHQQFNPDISVLPVPQIVCPSSNSSGDPMSLAVLGNDCTLDENVYLADMIALKYLSASGPRDPDGRLLGGEIRKQGIIPGNDISVDRTFANISMATQQYFQRHNLLAPTAAKGGGLATPPPAQAGGRARGRHVSGRPPNSTIRSSNDTMDIRTIKTLPKLT